MNSYTVDASVYTLPPDLTDTLELTAFIKRLDALFKITKKRHIKNLTLFFMKNDMKIQGMFITKEKAEKIKQTAIDDRYKRLVDDLLERFTNLQHDIIAKCRYKTVRDDKNNLFETVKCFENYFEFKSISLDGKSDCVPDTASVTNNAPLSASLKKNIFMLSVMNNYLYKDTSLHKIAAVNTVPSNRFDVSLKAPKADHKFADVPPANIEIENTSVECCDVYGIVPGKQFTTLDSVLESAKSCLGHIDITKRALESIEEYDKYIRAFKIPETEPDYSNLSLKYRRHKDEYLNTLYDHLNALNKLGDYIRQQPPVQNMKPGMGNINFITPNFSCKTGFLCTKCRGYLPFWGYNCTDESDNTMKNLQVAGERTIGGKVYRYHLRPYTYGLDGPNKAIESLTLRVHFRLNDSYDKIEIGWMGRHLYLPPKNTP